MGPLGIGWAPMSRHRDHTLPASVTHWADVDPSLQFAIGAVCRLNKTLPLSPGVSTQLDFDARYVQRTVRLDIVGMETLCSRWVNAPLDHPLRFELRPFSRHLEQAWAHAVTLMLTYARMNITLPEPAAASFDEFLLSLVLQQHPHNYSEDLFRQSGATTPRIVREAEHWMRTGGPEASVSKIAARVGMSLRSLEAGFREWRQSTSTQYLRKIRLEAARADLLSPSETTTVTSVALNQGFFHLPRFSAYYQGMFGEPPGHTLRCSRLRSKGG
jgi:AraC-like DNA-binding protein